MKSLGILDGICNSCKVQICPDVVVPGCLLIKQLKLELETQVTMIETMAEIISNHKQCPFVCGLINGQDKCVNCKSEDTTMSLCWIEYFREQAEKEKK